MPERSWQTDADGYRFGVGGLDLRHAADVCPADRYLRLKNVRRTVAGGFTSRRGQTRLAAVATPAAQVHSLVRLEDPQNNTFVRVAGIDTGLWSGQSSLQPLATGFSGFPLSFVPYRPPQSAETWVYVGDSAKMVKVRRDGLVLPIGLAAPEDVGVANQGTTRETVIEEFESGWSDHLGTCTTAVWTTVTGTDNDALEVVATPVTTPGYTFAAKALSPARDLTRVGSGGDAVDASDDDLMRIDIWVDNPTALGEVRLYLVSGAGFNAADTVLPGVVGGDNLHGYVAVLRPNPLDQPEAPAAAYPVEYAPAAVVFRQGAGIYTQFGVSGRPLRRGEFRSFGSAPDWSDIRGAVVAVSTANATTPVTVTFDFWRLMGGSAVDSTEADATDYDYRYTHYDPRTGDESNGSPQQATTIAGERQRIRLNAETYGDVNMRQRWYRRGGTLLDNWYYVGVTSGDGVEFVDEVSDETALGSGLTLPDDHQEPVTSTDRNGNAVSNVPLRSLWGPVAGLYLMGCGDPYRKGHVYWTKPGEPGHWPSTNTLEVCAPSEELLAGLIYDARPWVFSRERLFPLFLQSDNAPTRFTAQPSACGRGLAGPWAYAVGAEIYFVARDGIYATSGNTEKLLSADLAPLFNRVGESLREPLPSTTLGGYGEGGYGLGGFGTLNNSQITAPPPIDWTAEAYLRLEVHETDLWFSYMDVTGRIETLTYSLIEQEWRWDLFGKPPRVVYAERYGSGTSRLLMGSTNGVVYSHEGTSDDGDPIDGLVRTGVRSQGAPRADKLYGDLALEVDTQGAQVSVRSYLGPEQTLYAATTLVQQVSGQTLGLSEVPVGEGRRQVRIPDFDGGIHARGLAIECVWLTAATPPVVYGAEVSYFVDPDRIEQRATDWSDCGIAGLKQIKGLVLEVDTGGQPVEYAVEADGAEQTRFIVTTQTRQQLELTFAVEARLVRLRPTPGAPPHLRYGVEWLVEPLPLALATWESRPLDLGQFGWFVHFDAYVTLRSTVAVTLTLTFDGDAQQHYTLASTGGVDRKVYVAFDSPRKTRLVSYRLAAADGTTPFLVYREETFVRIAPWGGASFVVHHPFGGVPVNAPTREGPGSIVVSGV